MKLNLTVNGNKLCLDVKPGAMLVDVLRDAGFKSVKKGCGEGNCGACAVEINGRPRNSCLIFAGHAEGAKITTAEGLGNPEHPHPIQQAFVEAGSTQCGFCNPGSLIAVKALLDANPHPNVDEIKEALDGNLCRCTGYIKRIEAVLSLSKQTKTVKRQTKAKTTDSANKATDKKKSTASKARGGKK